MGVSKPMQDDGKATKQAPVLVRGIAANAPDRRVLVQLGDDDIPQLERLLLGVGCHLPDAQVTAAVLFVAGSLQQLREARPGCVPVRNRGEVGGLPLRWAGRRCWPA
jgi:hypothetical protein